MPVTTITASEVVYVGGKPQIATSQDSGHPQNGHQQKKGSRSKAPGYNKVKCRAQQRSARMDLVEEGGIVAVDCEGTILGGETGLNKTGLGRVSVVNERDEAVYDTFVFYPRGVLHRPNPQKLKLGVTYKDILPGYGAQPIAHVLKAVQKIFDMARIIVGHGIGNDINMLRGLPWEKYDLRDTQSLWEYRQHARRRDGDPGLATLVENFLHGTPVYSDFRNSSHDSTVDAKATMALYILRKEDFESAPGNNLAVTWTKTVSIAWDITNAGVTVSLAATPSPSPPKPKYKFPPEVPVAIPTSRRTLAMASSST